MSDALKHECGLAYIRLLKPFAYYRQRYGDTFYGLHKLYLLMEKQRNRGQDGAGIGVLKLGVPYGEKFLKTLRVSGGDAIHEIFKKIETEWQSLEQTCPGFASHPERVKEQSDFAGEVLLGHLRYATQGLNSVQFCHPYTISNHEPVRNVAMAGNFNLVNTEALFQFLNLSGKGLLGQSDLGAMIETVYHFLDIELTRQPGHPDIKKVLRQAVELFDGGFVFGGLMGSGDSFIVRDKQGIRPAFIFRNEEFIVAASERSAIMTCFDVSEDAVEELPAGHALIVKADGAAAVEKIAEPSPTLTPCSFERIYFSRGNDTAIYRERIQLGRNVIPSVLNVLHHDLERAVFSYIPNTAETAFYGLLRGMQDHLDQSVTDCILQNRAALSQEDISRLLAKRIRTEKVIQKDVKMRTFIADDSSRDELVSYVYDITYGVIRPTDTLVVIDDSIVRGTTLKKSILKILDRLHLKKIVVVSSAPQIRYPDCYGIDMSKLGDFIAFQAATALLKDRNMEEVLAQTYQQCKKAREEGLLEKKNYVKDIYARFSDDEISKKISEMLRPEDAQTEVEIIYQTIEGLHQACPMHRGDWYFTGNYPTPGGTRVSNMAFLNYMEKKSRRGY